MTENKKTSFVLKKGEAVHSAKAEQTDVFLGDMHAKESSGGAFRHLQYSIAESSAKESCIDENVEYSTIWTIVLYAAL